METEDLAPRFVIVSNMKNGASCRWSREEDLVSILAQDEVDDKPYYTGEELSQYHSQKEFPEPRVYSESTVPQDDEL